MKQTVLSSISEALEKGQALQYAYVRELSCVAIGKAPCEIHPNELLEARFFEPGREIRIFSRDSKLFAAELTEEPTDCYIEKTIPLCNPKIFGAEITVRDYLEPDCDGQMCVVKTCLAGWKGEADYE